MTGKTKFRGFWDKAWGSKAGYAAYRYGPKSKKPITLPRVYTGKARKHVVHEVIDMLGTGRETLFEHEGSARHGIRSALCLKGYRWQVSDAEAEALVLEGLKEMGAERPSHIEGQWHYATPRENCSWCWRHLDDESRERGERFCSTVCAKSAMVQRDYETSYDRDAIGRRAYYLVLREAAPEQACKACGKLFRTYAKGVSYCSKKCVDTAKIVHADRACECCGTTYHPLKSSQTTCSKSCGQKMGIKRRQQLRPEKSCPHCRSIFRPSTPWAEFCSPACGTIIRNARQSIARANAGTRRPRLTGAIFDQLFGVAA